LTDFQYKSILEMVMQILKSAKDLESAKAAIEAIQRAGDGGAAGGMNAKDTEAKR